MMLPPEHLDDLCFGLIEIFLGAHSGNDQADLALAAGELALKRGDRQENLIILIAAQGRSAFSAEDADDAQLDPFHPNVLADRVGPVWEELAQDGLADQADECLLLDVFFR